MKKIGIIEAIDMTNEYSKMLPKDRIQLRKKRLYDLVTYARDNSAFYRDKYTNLPENFTLQNLPITQDHELMADYNAWCTDPNVSLESLQAYIDSWQNNSGKYMGKYHCVTSSGTDGSNITMLYDSNCGKLLSAGYIKHCLPTRSLFIEFIKRGGKLASVYSDGAFFPSVFASMRRHYIPLRRTRSRLFKVQDSTARLSADLGRFKPTLLSGFPSALGRIADERKAGRIKINPICILADGEQLSPQMRQKLNTIFYCNVISSYSCAEAGCIAYECKEHHLHINDDWVIVEPIDIHGQPVAEGVPSDMVLVTNLMNYTTPIIRYALDDRIIMHTTPCSCGNTSPYIEVIGKSIDQVAFNDGQHDIFIPMTDLDEVFASIPEVKRYQILIYPNNHIALRLSGAKGMDKTLAFFKAEKVLRNYLKSIGISTPAITLEKEDPQADPISGKYKTVITM